MNKLLKMKPTKIERTCEKYFATLDDGTIIYYTRKEYEKQCLQDKILASRKKEEDKQKKLCKPKKKFFRRKKIHCEFSKDLTTECVESNPGPIVQKICIVCSKMDITSPIREIVVCDNCLNGYAPQSFVSQHVSDSIIRSACGAKMFLLDGFYTGQSFLEHYVNIPHDMRDYVSLIEDVLILLHGLIRSRHMSDRYVSVVSFCKLRGARPDFMQLVMYVVGDLFSDSVMTSFRKDPLYDEICNRIDYEPQDETNVFSKIRFYLDSYTKLKNTTIYKKVYKFMLYVLSLEILKGANVSFESLNFDKMEAAAIKRTHKPGFDMLHCVLDTVTFICEKGTHFCQTGDISSFFHSGSSYEKWFVDANKLIRDSKFLSNPEPHGVNRFKFISELKDSIEKGGSILKFTADLDKYERMTIGKLLNDLQIIESNELTRKAAQMPRKDPFAVLVHGSSSIAKSQLKQILFYHYGKIFDHPVSAEYMYTRCPTDEYWSGFNSTQWCIVMDDIAFLKPTGEVDPTLKEMLQVKNSVPYCPPQAALEDKGRTPVRAELLIGTTNTKNLNLHAYFACPFAIARRLSYIITAKIKPQYAKHSIMADSSKIPITPDGEYMNIWNFSISVPRPSIELNVDNQGTIYKEIAQFTDINDMLVWYINAAKEHEVSQTKASNADATMMDIALCTKCYYSEKKCKCYAEQDDIIEEESVEVSIEDELSCMDYTWWFKIKMFLISRILSYQFNPSFNFTWNWPIYFLYMFMVWPTLAIVITMIFLIGNYTYKYMWFVLAHIAQFYYGYFWKVRLAKYLVGSDYQVARLIFRTKGYSVYNRYFTTPQLIKLSKFMGTLVALLVTYNILFATKNEKVNDNVAKKSVEVKGDDSSDINLETTRYDVQGSTGVIPVPTDHEKVTFYYQDPYSITEVDISPQSKTAQGDVLKKKISRNVARIEFVYADAPANRSSALNVKGTCWLVNAHVFKNTPSRVGIMNIFLENVEQNVSRNLKGVAFDNKDITFLKGTDLAMINIRALPPGLSLREYFPVNDPIRGNYNGSYFIRNLDGTLSEKKVNNIVLGTCFQFKIPAYHSHCSTPTQAGDCGSPLVINTGSAQVIIGMHMSGNVNTGGAFAQVVSQRMLDALLSNYAPQVDANEIIRISADNYPRSLTKVHDKCTLRWLPQGTATMMGSFTGYRPAHKSKVKETLLCKEVVKDGYIADHGAPNMTWLPWHKAIVDMTKPNLCFHNSTLDECAEAFANDILGLISHEDLMTVQVYTQDVALNGVDGVTFVDRINIRTSAGNPYRKSKLNFIELDDNNKIIKIDESIQKRIVQIEEAYTAGKRFHPQFCGHLKDGPLPLKKCIDGKTRVFTSAEMAWCVVVRRYLLPHIRLMQNNPFVFEAMPGIVAQSTEWTDLYTYLTKFGKDRIVAGDYGKFDKKMAAPFILAAFKILRKISEKAGWSEEDMKYIDCIAYDTAFPCIDFNGDLIEIQGNPSGHPLTVVINCLVNSLYMRYAYKLISQKHVSTFKQYVNLATYGDDNIMSISPECPHFNHTRIAAAMKAIGVEYTMADKEAESVPYIHIDDASFLRRGFVMDDDLGAVVAPLEHSSIDKMLTCHLDNGILSDEAHAVCAIETALREYFFYGKEKFEDRSVYFKSLIHRMNIQAWVKPSTFPTYNQCAYAFWMRYGDKEKASAFVSGDQTPKKAEWWFDSPHAEDYSC